jgi:hypothetical protein
MAGGNDRLRGWRLGMGVTAILAAIAVLRTTSPT